MNIKLIDLCKIVNRNCIIRLLDFENNEVVELNESVDNVLYHGSKYSEYVIYQIGTAMKSDNIQALNPYDSIIQVKSALVIYIRKEKK